MLKANELTDSHSCINRAAPDEMVFVLLARDVCAPIVIRKWVELRIASGKNLATDSQILEALQAADYMERQRREIRKAGNANSSAIET